ERAEMDDANARREGAREVLRQQQGPAGALHVEGVADIGPPRLRRKHVRERRGRRAVGDEREADAIGRQASGESLAVGVLRQPTEEMRFCAEPAETDRNIVWRAAA